MEYPVVIPRSVLTALADRWGMEFLGALGVSWEYKGKLEGEGQGKYGAVHWTAQKICDCLFPGMVAVVGTV
jgi:hypothetical protein